MIASFILSGLAATQEAQLIKDSFLTHAELDRNFGIAFCDIKMDNILLDRRNRRLVYCTIFSPYSFQMRVIRFHC
jgi:hypothetical protein